MICTKCKKTVKVIAKFLDDQLNAALDVAQKITEEVKKVIGNPLFELLASQISAITDFPIDKILEVIQSELTVVDHLVTCKDLTGMQKLNCYLQAINLLPKSQRDSLLLRIKSALTALIDGARFKGVVYDTAAQFNYFNEQVNAGKKLEVLQDENLAAETVTEILQPVEEKETAVNIAESVLGADQLHAMPFSGVPVQGDKPQYF